MIAEEIASACERSITVENETKATQLSKEATALGPLRLVKSADLFRQMQELYDSIAGRAFEIFEKNGRIFGRDLENWFQAESELLHPVPVNIAESHKGLTVRAEVPGFKPGELELSVEGSRLSIAGRRQTAKERKGEKTIHKEQRSDRVMRVVNLPAAAEADKVTATLEDGMLTIEIPKAVVAKHIPVETHTTRDSTESQAVSVGTRADSLSAPGRTRRRKAKNS
jgi:HSP20 family protein